MSPTPHFQPAQVVITANAQALCKDHGVDPGPLVARHLRGDWGTVDEHDAAVNDEELRSGGQLLSAFTERGLKLWVITDSGHETTTVLLPDDY